MKLYKLKIEPKSSQITPWHSDTIFGSLCWVLAQSRGQEKLRDFLHEYTGNCYPMVVSNGFPGDYLPKPMGGNTFNTNDNRIKQEAIRLAQKAKEAKKTNLLSLEEFNTIINNGQVEIKPKEKLYLENGVMHNQLSRLTGTTSDGSLYELTETFWSSSHISIYLGISSGWEKEVFTLFEILSLKGFGKRISVGKGYFKIMDCTEFKDLTIPESPNSIVTLSNYVPRSHDPYLGQYKTFVKYGKLGQNYAVSGNPFKKPLLMIMPGAVFWTENPQFAYGRMVKGISPSYPEVVQCGCALAIPSYIEKVEME
ncbi:CRISPR-associated protein, Csm4 family [Desulforamulus reducens MI-1]|uniref:CRISPR system Cms protein Csm4 n=1 Tax=Desulforamulus reducens (strain ATCC BAA-1160 / DSM 100696 / MI-1) TaxID=349161 RepID=A4J505_DESRM|nr:hypothetical protein [Desulforamulus reducens]ABO50158.1 CRISPR-associated protein, Csm4 family [Desulforamulus reducens MI-1]